MAKDVSTVESSPGRSIVSRVTYERACSTVAELEMHGVQSHELVIVANHLKMQTPNRLGRQLGFVAVRDAVIGIAVSLAFMLVLSTMNWIDPLAQFSHVLVASIATGFFVGGGIGFLSRYGEWSLNPLEPTTHDHEADYDVIANDTLTAIRARRILG